MGRSTSRRFRAPSRRFGDGYSGAFLAHTRGRSGSCPRRSRALDGLEPAHDCPVGSVSRPLRQLGTPAVPKTRAPVSSIRTPPQSQQRERDRPAPNRSNQRIHPIHNQDPDGRVTPAWDPDERERTRRRAELSRRCPESPRLHTSSRPPRSPIRTAIRNSSVGHFSRADLGHFSQASKDDSDCAPYRARGLQNDQPSR